MNIANLAFLYLGGIILFLFTVILLSNINLLIKTKADKIVFDSKKEKLEDKLNNTNDLFQLIDFMISCEIATVLKTYAALNSRYEILNMDGDLQNISTNVYKGIKPEILLDNQIVPTSDYMLKYITDHTSLIFISEIKKYNTQLTETRGI